MSATELLFFADLHHKCAEAHARAAEYWLKLKRLDYALERLVWSQEERAHAESFEQKAKQQTK